MIVIKKKKNKTKFVPSFYILLKRRDYPIEGWSSWQGLIEAFDPLRYSLANLLTFCTLAISGILINSRKKSCSG